MGSIKNEINQPRKPAGSPDDTIIIVGKGIKSKTQKVKRRILEEKEISAMVAAHSRENPVDFSDCDISSHDVLTGHDLSGASFRNTDCFDLDLEGCNLTGCDFSGARFLRRVNFHNCTLDLETARRIVDHGGHFPGSVKIVDLTGNQIDLNKIQPGAADKELERMFLLAFSSALIEADGDPEKEEFIIHKACDYFNLTVYNPIDGFVAFTKRFFEEFLYEENSQL